ncbi:carbonic anhydrase [Syncephalis plumigaleata]|nr:carbonic anhydrase [Syncephalis plumigaleata]
MSNDKCDTGARVSASGIATRRPAYHLAGAVSSTQPHSDVNHSVTSFSTDFLSTTTTTTRTYCTTTRAMAAPSGSKQARSTDLEQLLENNRQFSEEFKSQYPELLAKLAVGQDPEILWIGCSDSRVQPTELLKLRSGDLFIHRNIANVFPNSDLNALSVLQYAVEHLKVKHIIVCGHTKCGGCAAALSNKSFGLLDNWLRNIEDVYEANYKELSALTNYEEREKRLIELNAIRSAHNIANTTIVQQAWQRGQPLQVHAWVYDVTTALIDSLTVIASGADSVHPSHTIEP